MFIKTMYIKVCVCVLCEMCINMYIKGIFIWGAWLAQSEEHVSLDLGVVSSSPMLGVEITLKIKS